MKTRVSILLLVAFTALAEQSLRQMFERARLLDEKNQNLNEAIQLYGQVVSQAKDQRALAAQAQLQIGLIYERLGKKAEALRAYHLVLNDFADQPEAAREARARIAAAGENGRGVTTRQVWAGPGVNIMGAPSPDGRYLSFVDSATGNLAIRDLATGEKHGLTQKRSLSDSPEYATISTFSPDGKQLAYAWLNRDNFFDIRLIRADGSNPRVLYSNKGYVWVQPGEWSRDGKQILAILRKKEKGYTDHIALLNVADGSARILKTLDHRYPEGMIFTPDGRGVVYGFAGDIFLLASDGSGERPLLSHPARDFPLGWTSDGKKLVFASDRTGTTDVWLIPFADGKTQGAAELLKRDIGQITPMGLTRNGSLFYSRFATMQDAYMAAMDPATGTLTTAPALLSQRWVGANWAPDWSPDGKFLAYVSKGSISIRALETGQERQLTPRLRFLREVLWSPDGRSLLVRATDEGDRWGLYKVDTQTGEATPVVQADVFWGNPEWSRDGKAVFCRAGARRLVRREIASGQEQLLAADTGSGSLALSPDGSTLAFTVADQQAKATLLKVMPAAGGEARELLRLSEQEGIPVTGLTWMPDGGQILFIKSLKERNELWAIPAEGGQPRKLNLAMKGLRALRFHRDGQQIAFTAGGYSAEVWVMENFLPVARAGR
jgi:Tol biopolymer transport system component